MMKKDYFEGYYVKIGWKEGCIACIPSFHTDERGTTIANLQILGDGIQLELQSETFCFRKNGMQFMIQIEKNIFTNKGCRLHVSNGSQWIRGTFRYGLLTPLSYDIMGSFRYIPLLQCRHSVMSMEHSVRGMFSSHVRDKYVVEGRGYLEGDRGRDFPKQYFWTQSFLEGRGSIMLSVATVPLVGGLLPIKGCIAAICYDGVEYRMATYLGAAIEKINNHTVILKQKNLQLTVHVLEAKESTVLQAPEKGVMQRTIQESLRTKVYYSFRTGKKTMFAIQSKEASVEREWNE